MPASQRSKFKEGAPRGHSRARAKLSVSRTSSAQELERCEAELAKELARQLHGISASSKKIREATKIFQASLRLSLNSKYNPTPQLPCLGVCTVAARERRLQGSFHDIGEGRADKSVVAGVAQGIPTAGHARRRSRVFERLASEGSTRRTEEG